jgi:hypothetical protein
LDGKETISLHFKAEFKVLHTYFKSLKCPGPGKKFIPVSKVLSGGIIRRTPSQYTVIRVALIWVLIFSRLAPPTSAIVIEKYYASGTKFIGSSSAQILK